MTYVYGAKQQREEKLARNMGTLIRERRHELGLSQSALAESVDVTFQQIQKYEKGTNRVSAPTLHSLAEALRVPITYFFPEAGKTIVPLPPHTGVRVAALTDAVAALTKKVETLAAELAKLR